MFNNNLQHQSSTAPHTQGQELEEEKSIKQGIPPPPPVIGYSQKLTSIFFYYIYINTHINFYIKRDTQRHSPGSKKGMGVFILQTKGSG